MENLHRILVATDFSLPAKRALVAALSLSTHFSAHVDVLYVGTPVTDYAPLDRALLGEDLRVQLASQAEAAAESGMDAFLEGLPESERKRVGRRIEWGVPYEVVPRVAERGDYGLIVVGSHGWTGAKRVLVGSVAERIVRRATRPVLTVR